MQISCQVEQKMYNAALSCLLAVTGVLLILSGRARRVGTLEKSPCGRTWFGRVLFYQLKNGDHMHKVKKLINSLRVESRGQNSGLLGEAGIAAQLRCDQYSQRNKL